MFRCFQKARAWTPTSTRGSRTRLVDRGEEGGQMEERTTWAEQSEEGESVCWGNLQVGFISEHKRCEPNVELRPAGILNACVEPRTNQVRWEVTKVRGTSGGSDYRPFWPIPVGSTVKLLKLLKKTLKKACWGVSEAKRNRSKKQISKHQSSLWCF